MRLLLQYVLPFLLPFLIYAAYVALAKHRTPSWLDLDEKTWLMLGGTGLVLVTISLVTWTPSVRRRRRTRSMSRRTWRTAASCRGARSSR